MKIKSVVLSALIPTAETNETVFKNAVDTLAELGAGAIEYCTVPEQLKEKSAFLKGMHLQGVYLGAVAQKRNRSSICAVEKVTRQRALDLAKREIAAGVESGVRSVLLTSGWWPEAADNIPRAWDALERSMHELVDFGSGMPLTLEPGDRTVDACQLLGSTVDAVSFLQRFNRPGLSLTVDMSHCAQLGEEPLRSVTMAADCCRHVHLANCILDRRSPLYGDKHPPFDCEMGAFSTADAQKLAAQLGETVFPDADYLLGIEIINRNPDVEAGMNEILAGISWFFN